jgi:hypothetical protein
MSSILGKSINDLKSAIAKHGGVASPNRFAVYMTPPAQTLLNLDIQGSLGAALSGNFKVGNLLNDPRDIALLCESCNMPGRIITTLEYQSIRQAQKIPNGYINEDVTFSFILTQDYYMKKMFDKWMGIVIDLQKYRAQYQKNYTTDVIIHQLDKNNIPIYGVKLKRAYPIVLGGIGLDNNSENTVQKLTVTMTFDDFEQEDVLDTSLSAIGTVGGLLNNSLNAGKGALETAKKKLFGLGG